MQNYLRVLGNPIYRRIWMGFSVSNVGDAVSSVALIWLVYNLTHGSSQAVGLLVFFYTAPLVIGGLVAGILLDRFDKRILMMLDNTIRGIAMASIPLAQ